MHGCGIGRRVCILRRQCCEALDAARRRAKLEVVLVQLCQSTAGRNMSRRSRCQRHKRYSLHGPRGNYTLLPFFSFNPATTKPAPTAMQYRLYEITLP